MINSNKIIQVTIRYASENLIMFRQVKIHNFRTKDPTKTDNLI